MSEYKGIPQKGRELMERLRKKGETKGYYLNPDEETTLALCEGLVMNIDEYGYMGCPCRLMEGDKHQDLDVICPCDYRDLDLSEFGACYCSLYVTKEFLENEKEAEPIPERRPEPEEIKEIAKKRRKNPASAGVKTWRCKVCGYLNARELPPEECPICNAGKDRFEAFKI
jgi:ferredoxin-thioredoxin reductase catalytic subunit